MAISSALGTGSATPGVCTSTTRPSSPFQGQLIYETDTNRILVWDNSEWERVVMFSPTSNVINLEATTLQRSGNAFVNIVDIPIEINEWNMGGASGSRTLSTNIPTTARYIYADVFTTNSTSDHYNIEFSNSDCSSSIKNWVDTRGQQPSTQFGNMTTRRSVYLTHPGEVDNYTPNYGIWFSGILIPTSGRTLYWGSFGSGGQAWIYLKILGYSN